MRLSTVLAAPLILLALSIYVSALSETESANDTSTPAAQPQVLTNNSVHVITDSNYTELRNGDWLVLAYAPWCAFSQAILSHWHLHEDQPESGLGASALRNLTLTNETLRFARVNAQENTRTAALLEIRQYPSIKLILNGTHVWTYSSFSSSSLTDEGSEAEYSPAMIELWVVKKWKQQHILNQLPQSYSIWYKIQLDLHNMISRHSHAIFHRLNDLLQPAFQDPLMTYVTMILTALFVFTLYQAAFFGPHWKLLAFDDGRRI